MSPVIEISNVNFGYVVTPALENVDLVVKSGEFLGLVGPNGGGKSTLLKLILGLLEPQSGHVLVLGDSPQRARKRIGYVPQFVQFQRQFPISVRDTVLLGRLGKTRLLGTYTRSDKDIVAKIMQQLGIAIFADRPIDSLSGGELQRVLIARALASEPEIMILDEPTANIDMRGEKDIFDLLQRLHEDKTLIVVSHDIGFISEYVDRVACLNRTLICHATSELTGEMVQQMYDGPVRMIQHDHAHHDHGEMS